MSHTHSNFSGLVTLSKTQAITTSLKISEVFNKKHCDVLRTIKNIGCSENYHKRNFAFMIEAIDIGKGAKRDRKYYQLTKDGFMFLVMGFTGKVAAQFKEDFINAFNTMEQQLLSQALLGSETEAPKTAQTVDPLPTQTTVDINEFHYQQQMLALSMQSFKLSQDYIKLLKKQNRPLSITLDIDAERPERFIIAVKHALKLYPNLNKTQLLAECGYKKDDKTARAWLDAFEGEHWYCRKRSNAYTYNLNADDLLMEAQA